MTFEIKCEECGLKLGEIKKAQMSEEEKQQYREMMECPSGHQGSIVVVEV